MKPTPAMIGLSTMAWMCLLPALAMAVELRVPASVQAGQAFSVHLDGSGSATLYLIGPDHVVKRGVRLGNDVEIAPSDVRSAGQYRMIVCDASCSSAAFEVKAGEPAQLSFFVHPSRVPVSSRESINAFAFVFDRHSNLVLSPLLVNFQIRSANGTPLSRQSATRDGVAWATMDSTPHEGRMQVTATFGKLAETRVIQQVAADPCALHMKAVETGNKVLLETDPIRDCSGNPLPDGTVVSFTKADQSGRSTVDTPIRKGIAKTDFSLEGPAKISVACGVALGNEVAVNGKP